MFVSVSSAADTLTPAQALTQRMVALDGMRAAIVQKIYANGVVLEESQAALRWLSQICAGKSIRRFLK